MDKKQEKVINKTKQAGGNFALFAFASGFGCRARGKSKMCKMRDSQNAIGEKVRWGKNLNFYVGWCLGLFYLQPVICQPSMNCLKSQSQKSFFLLFYSACA